MRGDGEEPDVRTLTGWRRELVGAELLELLDGHLSLSVLAGKGPRQVQIGPRPANG
jgi:ribonuclease D